MKMMKIKKEQGMTCEELRELEVGFEYDYFNHVPRGTLTAYGLQGYVFSMHWLLPHYYIDELIAMIILPRLLF